MVCAISYSFTSSKRNIDILVQNHVLWLCLRALRTLRPLYTKLSYPVHLLFTSFPLIVISRAHLVWLHR